MKNIFWSRKILFRFHESIFLILDEIYFSKVIKNSKILCYFLIILNLILNFFFIVIYFVLNHFLIFFNFIQ